MDETDELLPMMSADVEAEIKEVMGLFDTPAFARRGQELEETLLRIHGCCGRARAERLEMVRLRLRQWAGAVAGPEGWRAIFAASIEPLWPLSEADPPRWAEAPAPSRQQRRIARDLVAAVVRFNRRWTQFLDGIRLDHANLVIDHYNRYYLIEKECVLGSARLAARFFRPVPRLTREQLLAEHPLLPVPALIAGP
jgi:hypothetical protein